MPTISDSRSTAATTVVANVVSGNRFEFLPPGRVTRLRGGMVCDIGGVTATFSIGDRIIAEDYVLPVESAVGVVARDRDYNWIANGKPGERVVVSVNNATAFAAQTTLLLELL